VVQFLRGAEIGEIAMIGVDKDREGIPEEIMTPGFKGTDNCKEFSIVDLIVPFSRRE
jgi:hypothetical protein